MADEFVISTSSRSNAFRSGLRSTVFRILALVALVIIWAIVKLTAAYDLPYVPASENIALFVFDALAVSYIKSRYAKYILGVWLIWFVLGSFSLFAVNQGRTFLDYSSSSLLPNRFYLLSILFAELGILIPQVLGFRWGNVTDSLSPNDKINIVVLGFLALTPLIYTVSVYQATGDLPILSGRDLTAQMYEEDYGFFHRFGIFVAVSAILLWMRFLDGSWRFSTVFKRIALISALLVILFICGIDGRRANTVFAIVAIIMFYFCSSKSYDRFVWVTVLGFGGIGAYLTAAVARAGEKAAGITSDPSFLLTSFAMEFRDYTYAFSNIRRAHILSKGYDWFGSTFVGFIPSPVATLLQINKEAITKTDSARSLMDFFSTKLGVRIGLQGELWLAYGWWGLLVFIPLGMVFAWTAYRASICVDPVAKSIWLVVLSLWALCVLGQSTVTFGLLLPLLYLGLGCKLMAYLGARSGSIRRARA